MITMISIIIPVYNTEKYIKRAFDSLLSQSIGFKNLEVIFIDDASTDGSPQIIQDYSDKYDNVKSFYLKNNSGAGGKPRNIGLSHATKDYIMFLDSDDYLLDNACEILYNEIKTENIDVVSGGYTWDGSNSFEDLWMSILTDPHDSYDMRFKTTKKILTEDFPLLIDSIDDYESIIGDFGFVTKIYRKSFLENHSINFPERVIAEDSVFLLNVLLNANGIKYIDEIVYCYTHERTSNSDLSMSFIHSKNVLKGLLDSFYNMYSLAVTHDKSGIFKQYLLPQKLDYFLNFRLLKADLAVSEILELLIHAAPLFRLCGKVNSNLSYLFEFISNKDYENALKVIFGENIPNQHDIKVISNVDLFKEECNLVELQCDSWLNQFENEKPHLFIYKLSENSLLDEIISYCDKNNIGHILFTEEDFNFKQTLDSIKFRYVPFLKHLVFVYRLMDLAQLTDIFKHFNSIDYPFKHILLIADEKNLFLSDTVLESDFHNLEFEDNYYFCFPDLNVDFNHFQNCLTHNQASDYIKKL